MQTFVFSGIISCYLQFNKMVEVRHPILPLNLAIAMIQIIRGLDRSYAAQQLYFMWNLVSFSVDDSR